MLERMLFTPPSRTLFAQRCVLALVMAPHGAQKALGLFGGYGPRATMAYFTGTLGVPAALAFLVIVAESLGALALLLGAGTRLAAFGIAAVMVGAVLTSHLSVGFFMNWSGTQNGEGFEYHLLALALAIPLMVRGGGSWAFDSVIATKLGAHPEAHRDRQRCLRPIIAIRNELSSIIHVPPKENTMNVITRQELQSALSLPNLVLLEALPEKYYRKGHLPGAQLFPHDRARELAHELAPDLHAPVVVYCASVTCKNSHLAAEALTAMGYEDVKVYVEGKADWELAGLVLER